MSLNAATIAVLIAKGLGAVDILEVAQAMEVASDPTSAERQARYRERRNLKQEDWDALRGRVFERDGFACTYCGATENLACDHIVPLVQGGSNEPDNLTTACRSCNCAKSGRTPEEWLA